MDQRFAPTRVRDGRHNLPAELTRFVGREAEIAEVQRLLSSTRLLTLAGSAGVGKTRLALKVAADVARQYGDGVWLVELAPLADPALVPKAVALALAVPEQPGRPVRASLVDALSSKQLLLVLDTCEHLVQACAELVDALLRACPDLRVLATSRQSLHVSGETTWRVPSLALPPADSRFAPESLAQYDSVRLFVERALAALPTFVITEDNASTIARICAHLDGIPLAIELAAARVAVLSPSQIDDRLRDRFRLLTDGSRTALPRQQTLRATLDWSFGLLSEPERVLFRRLAVFAGGWTLEAAEAVCAGDESWAMDPRGQGLPSTRPPKPIAGDDVLDLLSRLVDKSLVIFEAQPLSVSSSRHPSISEAPRYRLLETMREYAWDKLGVADEVAAVRDRHRDWALALVEEADRKLRGPEQREWLTRLEREHDNLRAALAWRLGGDRDAEAGLRLAGALAWFWRIHGHIGEGRRWLDLVLATPGGEALSVRPRALSGAGLLAYPQGDYDAATALLDESLWLARTLGDRSAEAWALHGLGRVAEARSDFGRANAVFEESLAHFRDRHDTSGCAYSLLHLANVARERTEYTRAAALYAETLTTAREVGDTWILGWTLAHAANLAFRQGIVPRAAKLYREGLVLLDSIQATWGIAECLFGLTCVAGVQGQPNRAAQLFGAEQALRAKLGTSNTYNVNHAAYRRSLTAVRDALGEARFDALAREGGAVSLTRAVAYALAVDDDEAPPGQGAEWRSASPSSWPLTPREREVAVLIARGSSNREIAAVLVITPRTADTHVMNILTKLELHSRAQVAAWAAEHGLLDRAERG